MIHDRPIVFKYQILQLDHNSGVLFTIVIATHRLLYLLTFDVVLVTIIVSFQLFST